MLGWLRLAAAVASRRNRSTKERSVANSGKRTFTATGRSSSWSRARKTSAMPPRPRRRWSSYRPLKTVGPGSDMRPQTRWRRRSASGTSSLEVRGEERLGDGGRDPAAGLLAGAGLPLDDHGDRDARLLALRAGEPDDPCV